MSETVNRREFIKKIVHAGSAISLGSALLPLNSVYGEFSSINADETLIDLAVVKGEVSKSLTKVFEILGGINKFIKANATVLIKPNISFPNPPNFGTTTNPLLVKALCEQCLSAGAKKVIVLDHTMRDSELCFETTGVKNELKSLPEVELLALDKESYYEEIPVNGKVLKSVLAAKLISQSDILINLPCAKSHIATGVSFGLKNLMGLIWDRNYFHSGVELHTAIAELSQVIRPQLIILDATRILVTNGPTGPGLVQEPGIIIAGTDPLAVDSYGVSLAKWNNRSYTPQTIKHLKIASELGIGQISMEKLIIKKAEV